MHNLKHVSFKKELDVTEPIHTETSTYMCRYQVQNIQIYQIIGIPKSVPKCTF